MGAEASGVDQLLKQQLHDAQLELERLEELIQQVPELMEQRCLQELRQVAHQNHQLLSERQRLIQLLQQGEEQHANSHPQAWPSLRPFQAWVQRNRTVLLSGLGTCALAGLGAVGWQQRLALGTWFQASGNTELPRPIRTQQPMAVVPIAGDSKTIVTLEARDASWIEVINVRSGELLLQDTLNAGDTRRVRLRSGLRLYAARPEALRYSLDGTDFTAWPTTAASGWLELKPNPAGLSRP